MNVILILLLLLMTLVIVYYNFFCGKKNEQVSSEYDESLFTIEYLLSRIKYSFNDILKTNLSDLNLNKEELDKRMKNKSRLRKSLKSCSYGDANAKAFVKEYIRDLLLDSSIGLDESNISDIICFSNPKSLTSQDKFEILLYTYKKRYGAAALEMLIVENDLDRLKEEERGFSISQEDIERVYKEKIARRFVDFQDRLEIVVQRLYQLYKGYGAIDEIRDMKIDGVSGGVSGILPDFFKDGRVSNANRLRNLPMAYDSIWLFFKGKNIHLKCIGFGCDNELKRICKNIYRYNNPGQLSEVNGYKVNEMIDGSRVVVARPPFCESWVFFVRKFDTINAEDMEKLITDTNNNLPINFMRWIIKGCRIIAVTGAQGSGKTTLLMSLIKYISPAFTLRIQEMAFELHLRKTYPDRNIVTFQETASINSQEGIDLQKKTDGTVNILGEVATAPVASQMIQMAQVASLFTMFTHHAKTAENLVTALRNCLLQTGVFSNEKVAEKQVAEVVNFDIHLAKDISGHRYIQRITEIIPLNQDIEYPEDYKYKKTVDEKLDAFFDTAKTYFERITDRKAYEVRDIIVYEQGEYRLKNVISNRSIEAIINCLNSEVEAEEFKRYICQCMAEGACA